MKKKWVYQERETDCGAAAVAMLCDVTYEEAKVVLYASRRVGVTFWEEVLDAVRHFGGKPLFAKGKSVRGVKLYDLDHYALLSDDLLSGKKAYGHWAVWDCEDQTIRDPYGYIYPFKVKTYCPIAWNT